MSWQPPTRGDEKKALIITDLLGRVNSGIDDRVAAPLYTSWLPETAWLSEVAAVLGDALAEYGYPTLSEDFQTWFQAWMKGDPFRPIGRWEMLYQRIEKASRELAHGDHEIQDPNSSGQGYAPSHRDTPFHAPLVQNGYTYSHSTRIWHPYYGRGGASIIRQGPEYTLRHTYANDDRFIGIGYDRQGRPVWESHLRGSARTTRGTTVESLVAYLRGAKRRAATKRTS